MSEKIDQIIESLKNVTLLESAELVKKIEETFDVDASTSVGPAMVMAAALGSVEEIEEKTEFNLMLDEVPSDKRVQCTVMGGWLLENLQHACLIAF